MTLSVEALDKDDKEKYFASARQGHAMITGTGQTLRWWNAEIVEYNEQGEVVATVKETEGKATILEGSQIVIRRGKFTEEG
jgi:hypothetical protein